MFEVLTENKAEGKTETDTMGLYYRPARPDKCAWGSTCGYFTGKGRKDFG